MKTPVALVTDYRGDILECVHYGHLAAVDPSGLRHSLGDPEFLTFYRSSSKPIQCLPLYSLGLDKKYRLTDEELSIMSGSLWCGPRQVELITSIMEKSGIQEEMLVMRPTFPLGADYAMALRLAGASPRKIYHNCVGKHLALILVQRELGGPEADYYLLESKVQQEVIRYLTRFTDVPADKIGVGVDGCGVPVFAVPLDKMALSYLRLADPDLLEDADMAVLAKRNAAVIAKHPENLMDAKALCGVLCMDSNIIGKAGAQGVYTFGLKKEKMGVALKMLEGLGVHFGVVLAKFLTQIGYDNKETIERLQTYFPTEITNDTGWIVGEKRAEFVID